MSNQNPSKAVAAKVKFTDAKANSLANKVLRLELLQTNLAPLLDSMPHVKPVYAELVQLLADAKSQEFQLQTMKVDASKVVANRQALVKSADQLRSRIASALAFEHGATSVQLKEFGLRPRKPGGRKKKVPPSPTPTPAPQPESPAAVQAGTHAAAPAAGAAGGGASGTTK